MINRFLATICLAAAMQAAPTGRPAEPISWKFAHAEAQIVAGVDFKRLAQTPDGAAIRAQFVAALGAPLLDQTERLLLSAIYDGDGKRSEVLVLSGTFSLAQLRKLAMHEGAKMQTYKGLEIAAPAGARASDPHLAWLSGQGGGTMVLIGTRPALQASLERSRAQLESLAAVNPLYERAMELNREFPIWITCDNVPQGMGPRSVDRYVESKDFNTDVAPVDGFDVGVRTGAEGEINFWVWGHTDSVGERVLAMLRTGLAANERFLLSSWLPQLQATVDGATLALGTRLTPGTAAEKIVPLLAAFSLPVEVQAAAKPAAPAIDIRAKVNATVPATGMPARSNVAEPLPVPGEAPKKLVVRIQGLENGAKEIPFPAKP